MKPIWYFVGLLLLIMGGVITAAGIDQVLSPPTEQTVLSTLHPSLWWGGLMMVVGTVFFLTNRRRTVS